MEIKALIPILVAYALDCDLLNPLNMGIMLFGKRASSTQIGIKRKCSRLFTIQVVLL